MDWERKDPDDEFNWRDRRTMEVERLLNRLLDNDEIEHDAFLNCIYTVEKTIRETLKRGNTNGNL